MKNSLISKCHATYSQIFHCFMNLKNPPHKIQSLLFSYCDQKLGLQCVFFSFVTIYYEIFYNNVLQIPLVSYLTLRVQWILTFNNWFGIKSWSEQMRLSCENIMFPIKIIILKNHLNIWITSFSWKEKIQIFPWKRFLKSHANLISQANRSLNRLIGQYCRYFLFE